MTNTPSDQPDPRHTYLYFNLAIDEDIAAAKYEQKFGGPPKRIIEYMNLLWLGPVVGNDDGRDFSDDEKIPADLAA